MATTLITGATGFIGSHLARAVAARGDQVRVMTRRSSDVSALEGLEYERAIGRLLLIDGLRRSEVAERLKVSRATISVARATGQYWP